MGSAKFRAHVFKADRRLERIEDELIGLGQFRLKLHDTRLSLKQLRRLRDDRADRICLIAHDRVPQSVLIEPFVVGEVPAGDVHPRRFQKTRKSPSLLEIKAEAFHGVISAMMPAKGCSAPMPVAPAST